jgi:hypothetical protein
MGSNGAGGRDMASSDSARLISPACPVWKSARLYLAATRHHRHSSPMQNELVLIFRLLAAAAFFVLLGTGVWMGLNYQRLFGVDPTMPSETGSSRAYTQVQIFTVWAHALVATAAFALFLH